MHGTDRHQLKDNENIQRGKEVTGMGRRGFSNIHKLHLFVRKSEGNEKGARIFMTFCTFFCKLKKFIMKNYKWKHDWVYVKLNVLLKWHQIMKYTFYNDHLFVQISRYCLSYNRERCSFKRTTIHFFRLLVQVSSPGMVIAILRGQIYCLYLINEEIKTQRTSLTCPQSVTEWIWVQVRTRAQDSFLSQPVHFLLTLPHYPSIHEKKA